MKRVLALLSVSCGFGLAAWGVGGCGSGVATTTGDGFPLLGGSYRLISDVTAECSTFFGDRIDIDIDQSSNQLTASFVNLDNDFEILVQCDGTTDKNANIEFEGTTSDDRTISCSSTVIIEGDDNQDRTIPLACTIADTSCEVTYSDH